MLDQIADPVNRSFEVNPATLAVTAHDKTKIYGAADITADSKVRAQIRKLEEDGYGRYPVCVAKTQYSFSTDPALRGAPSGHVVNVREVRLSAGAEFIVAICGEIMTMPGLPKVPSADSIDVNAQGRIVGLF